ncbi:thioredoxin [gut metagenome]|uniref:Thioredoxin n=1 Tax=gut metagenome TaxID=749906 RepID=J9FDS6_9ZZZZ
MALEFTDSNYKDFLAEGKPVVIDFWAPWCGPCKMVGPVIEELSAEYEGKALIGKCNVDDNDDVAAEFGIRNIPTVLFFKDGKLVDKQVGSAPKATYAAKIEALLSI